MAKHYKSFLTVLTFIFLSSALPGGVLSQGLPFETIDMGEISYFRYGDPLFRGAELVIRDPESWEWFWELHTQGMEPSPPLPKINFVREMVIAVLLGYQGSGGGPRIEIISIEWPGNTPGEAPKKMVTKGIKVTLEETGESGQLTVITNPYHIVKVKNYLSVIFEHQPADAPCRNSTDCGKGDYCEKKVGDCSETGVCQVRPVTCPLYFRYDPVCGCDGKTYASECAAAVEGISVLHKGTCEVSSDCQGNKDCLSGQFCLLPEGTCSPPGTCTLRPEVCTQIYAPVCGCDGITYGNSCEVFRAGVSILNQGSCPK